MDGDNNTQPNPQMTPEPVAVQPADQNQSKSSKFPLVIILLIVAGLVIGGAGYYFLVFKKEKPADVQTVLTPALLQIESPQNDQATTSAVILIKGKTNPNSPVVAYTDNNEQTFESDAGGNFEGELNLDEGPNDITITAFGDENEENTQTRSVVFVKEEEL